MKASLFKKNLLKLNYLTFKDVVQIRNLKFSSTFSCRLRKPLLFNSNIRVNKKTKFYDCKNYFNCNRESRICNQAHTDSLKIHFMLLSNYLI